MAQDHAALDHAAAVQLRLANLPKHFVNGFCGYREIVGGIRIARGKLGTVIFAVGQIYVHKPVEMLEGFHTFIAAAVVHDGDMQTWLYRL